jgi:hypothetical protein
LKEKKCSISKAAITSKYAHTCFLGTCLPCLSWIISIIYQQRAKIELANNGGNDEPKEERKKKQRKEKQRNTSMLYNEISKQKKKAN